MASRWRQHSHTVYSGVIRTRHMRSAWTSTGATNFCRSTWRLTVHPVQLQAYPVDAITLGHSSVSGSLCCRGHKGFPRLCAAACRNSCSFVSVSPVQGCMAGGSLRHAWPCQDMQACGPRERPGVLAQIHWFSIINSCVTVLLLTGFLATILMRVLKNDFIKYTRDDDGGPDLAHPCSHSSLPHDACLHAVIKKGSHGGSMTQQQHSFVAPLGLALVWGGCTWPLRTNIAMLNNQGLSRSILR